MSGVLPTDKCKEEFLKLKDKRAYKFVTFKIDPEKGVVDVCDCVEKTVRLWAAFRGSRHPRPGPRGLPREAPPERDAEHRSDPSSRTMILEACETVGLVPVVAGRASSTPVLRVFSRYGSRVPTVPPPSRFDRGTRVRLQRRRRFPRAFRYLCCASPLTSPSLPARRQAEFTFQTLLDKLPADEPRYFVLDWSATTADDRQIDKIFFVSWVPDTCKAKTKMLYASSKQALRNALDGVQLDHQATDYDEVTAEEFNERSGV